MEVLALVFVEVWVPPVVLTQHLFVSPNQSYPTLGHFRQILSTSLLVRQRVSLGMTCRCVNGVAAIHAQAAPPTTLALPAA